MIKKLFVDYSYWLGIWVFVAWAGWVTGSLMVINEKNREVKNLVNKMVREEILEYWSSGSTTLIGLKGSGKQHAADGED